MSPLRDDAVKVNEALAALAAHDKETTRLVLTAPAGHLTVEEWAKRGVRRRELSAVLEERAGILARLALAVTK